MTQPAGLESTSIVLLDVVLTMMIVMTMWTPEQGGTVSYEVKSLPSGARVLVWDNERLMRWDRGWSAADSPREDDLVILCDAPLACQALAGIPPGDRRPADSVIVLPPYIRHAAHDAFIEACTEGRHRPGCRLQLTIDGKRIDALPM